MSTDPDYFIGLDLGQKQDFTAIAVVERRDSGPTHFLSSYRLLTTYGLRYLERIPLGTPYPRVVERIGRLTRLPEIRQRCTLVVDATGVGAPVVDLLRQANLDCQLVALTITGGEHAHRGHGHCCTVPKRDLIATLQVMLEEEDLIIAAELPERRRLVEELMALQVHAMPSGHESFGASGRVHDDLVLAVALACWQARKPVIGEQGRRLL